MLKNYISVVIISLITFSHIVSINDISTYNFRKILNEDPVDNNSTQYKTIDELMLELKEQRKEIEQRRIEEINAKKLEKENQKALEGKDIPQTPSEPKEKQSEKQPVKQEQSKIPSLIVRLRGKHTTKYLCSYNFVINNDNKESVLEKTLVTDYNTLLKRPSLKVRPNEVINFEFSEKPNEMKVYMLDEVDKPFKLNRGSMKVPTLDKKIIVIVEGLYDNGNIVYAVVLDIRN